MHGECATVLRNFLLPHHTLAQGHCSNYLGILQSFVLDFMPVPVSTISTMEAPRSPELLRTQQTVDHDNTAAIEVSDSEQEMQVCEFGQSFLCFPYLPQSGPCPTLS